MVRFFGVRLIIKRSNISSANYHYQAYESEIFTGHSGKSLMTTAVLLSSCEVPLFQIAKHIARAINL